LSSCLLQKKFIAVRHVKLVFTAFCSKTSSLWTESIRSLKVGK